MREEERILPEEITKRNVLTYLKKINGLEERVKRYTIFLKIPGLNGDGNLDDENQDLKQGFFCKRLPEIQFANAPNPDPKNVFNYNVGWIGYIALPLVRSSADLLLMSAVYNASQREKLTVSVVATRKEDSKPKHEVIRTIKIQPAVPIGCVANWDGTAIAFAFLIFADEHKKGEGKEVIAWNRGSSKKYTIE